MLSGIKTSPLSTANRGFFATAQNDDQQELTTDLATSSNALFGGQYSKKAYFGPVLNFLNFLIYAYSHRSIHRQVLESCGISDFILPVFILHCNQEEIR
jgi:hypothetical protein